MSLAITIGSVGGFVAPPLLNKIIFLANGNWRAAWFAVLGLMFITTILTIFFVKDKPADIGLTPYGINDDKSPTSAESRQSKAKRVFQSTKEWKVADAIRTFTFWFLFAGTVAYMVPMMMFMAHTVIYLRDMGHTPAVAAMAMSYYMLFSLGGRLLGGALGDRFEPRYIWAAGLFLEMAGILCFLNAGTLADIYLFTFFVGIGVGAASICMPTLLGNYFGPNSFASVIGVFYPIVMILGAASPYFAGLVYDARGSYLAAFIASAALAF